MDRSHGDDWWRASDGNWYPPESGYLPAQPVRVGNEEDLRSPPPPAPPPPPVHWSRAILATLAAIGVPLVVGAWAMFVVGVSLWVASAPEFPDSAGYLVFGSVPVGGAALLVLHLAFQRRGGHVFDPLGRTLRGALIAAYAGAAALVALLIYDASVNGIPY